MLFDSVAEVDAFMSKNIDKPVAPSETTFGNGLRLVARTYKTSLTTFTNVYDLRWPVGGSVRPTIGCHSPHKSITAVIDEHPDIAAVVNGGFFYLSDKDSDSPRHLAHNLAISDGKLMSLPIIDREALVITNNDLQARIVQAKGTLRIGAGEPLSWRGVRTSHAGSCTIFNLSNVSVHYVDDPHLGVLRQLDSASRFTPIIKSGTPLMDLGIIEKNGKQVIAAQDWGGSLDLFKYNFVIRCKRSKHPKDLTGQEVAIESIDGMDLSAIQGALTTGPSLSAADFESHNVNFDLSLCDKPPFIDRRTARLVLLRKDAFCHLVLFDSRKGSETFAGATPYEARHFIQQEFGPIEWGCFLDSGMTAKIAVRNQKGIIQTFGNRHYARWPKGAGKIKWIPDEGRAVGSSIALHVSQDIS